MVVQSIRCTRVSSVSDESAEFQQIADLIFQTLNVSGFWLTGWLMSCVSAGYPNLALN